jgi:hypothetical protein
LIRFAGETSLPYRDISETRWVAKVAPTTLIPS